MHKAHVRFFILALPFFMLATSACAEKENVDLSAENQIITITSSAFADSTDIPVKYTCDGEDVSPALMWEGIPEKAKSLALICDDPDAPFKTWVHWVIFNIPADTSGLPESVAHDGTLAHGIMQGVTDFKRTGYGGPCPPKGVPHRYFFKLYALDVMLDLEPEATKKELLEAMKGHVIGTGQLMGLYKRHH